MIYRVRTIQPATLSAPPDVAGPVLHLFDTLNRKKILWCSWKSNEHLEAGLTGKTDLDLLLDPARKADVLDALKECGYTLFHTPPHRSYPDIMDAFALDPETGALLHAHCHFALVIGEKHLKSFTLPWANTLLLHRHEQMNVRGVPVYATDPMDEMIILLLREALKFRWRDMARYHLGKQWSDPGMKVEFDWLKIRVDYDEFRARAIGLTSSPCSSQMTIILYKDLTLPGLLRLREIVQRLAAEKKWRRMSAPVAMLQAKWREGVFALTLLQSRFNISRPMITRMRTLPGDGMIIAITGIDGSGKSTIVREIHKTWRRKIDVARIYFGTGDGPKTLTQHTLLSLNRLRKKLGPSSGSLEKQNEAFIIGSGWPAIIWALAAAFQKKSTMLRALKMRARGMLVISDRWPQDERPGLNDGPLLSHLQESPNSLKRRAAALEARIFSTLTATSAPDLLIRLNIPADLARARKHDSAQPGLIEMKAEQMASLTFPATRHAETLDAAQPLDDVVLTCKKTIWSRLQERGQSPFIIESIGLPGAGKTTMSNALLQGNPETAGIDSLTKAWADMPAHRRIWIGARGIACEPPAWLAILKLLTTTGLWRNRYASALFLKMPFQRQLGITLLKQTNLILDQWMVQNMWSALLTAGKTDIPAQKLAPVIKALYRDMPVMLVMHEISPRDAALRIATRQDGKSRFDGQEAETITPQLEKASLLMTELGKACAMAKHEVVLAENAEKILPRLQMAFQ